MSGLFLVLAVLLGGVLQAVLPTAPWLGEVRPPILTGLVLYYAMSRERPPLGAAWLAGLVQDALGMLPLGVSSLGFCALALLVSRFRREVFADARATHAAFGGLAAAAVTAALYAMLRWPAAPGEGFGLPAPRVVHKVVSALALGALFTPAIFAAMERMERALGLREARDA